MPSILADWPYPRYYFEIPLNSSAGYSTGSTNVFDNQPNEGLDPAAADQLREIGGSVMDHLWVRLSSKFMAAFPVSVADINMPRYGWYNLRTCNRSRLKRGAGRCHSQRLRPVSTEASSNEETEGGY
jgi:hypothetical protein